MSAANEGEEMGTWQALRYGEARIMHQQKEQVRIKKVYGMRQKRTQRR